MENWDNLNKFLTLERKDSELRDLLSKELIAAASKGDKKESKRLLKEGAILNCFEEHLTPLISCIESNHYELALFFLKAKASITYRPNVKFIDALWYSLINKQHIFLSLFISQRCNLLRHPETSQTPLIFSTIGSDLKAVETLLSHYAIKVNERDGGGNTALHHNVSKLDPSQDDLEIGRLLIAAGADTKLPNLDGKTPNDLAVDFSAKSMLLSGELENKLEVKDDLTVEQEIEAELDFDNAPKPVTKVGNKIKI